MSANGIVHTAGGYGPPGGGYPPPGGGYGGPPQGAPPGGFGGAPPGGGYGTPPGAPPPGGFGAPPPGGFGPGGFPPPGNVAPGGDVNTTLPLVLSIICLACCCLPLGIGGLIYAMNANNAKKMGDMATAQAKAKTALILSIVGMVGGAIIATVYGVIVAMTQSSM